MKKLFSTVLTVCTATLILAACGYGSDMGLHNMGTAEDLYVDVGGKFSREILFNAQYEAVNSVLEWIESNPGVPVSFSAAYSIEADNLVRVHLSGSGVPELIAAMDFPNFVEFVYPRTVDASIPHEVPRSPVSVWENEGVTVKSARESYPVGTEFLLITAFHDVEGLRLFAPYSPLTVEKYVDGEWINISGYFFIPGLYVEMFDIPAGEEKTVQIGLITPEILGPGLYRAIYGDSFRLAQNAGLIGWDGIFTEVSSPDNRVVVEFIVTLDAEPLPPRENIGW